MKDTNENLLIVGRSILDLTEEIKTSWPKSSGKTQYLRYLKGEKLTYREALLAKCAECCGGYVDGRIDCKIKHCPTYQSMPYKGLE
jgi:hypothetical protein